MIENIPLNEIEIKFARSSGPGGQNVNKTNTKVLVIWRIYSSIVFSEEQKKRISTYYNTSILQATNQETRSQLENRKRAISRLNEMVNKALIDEKERISTKPTYHSKIKRLEMKRQHSQTKSLRKRPKIEEF